MPALALMNRGRKNTAGLRSWARLIAPAGLLAAMLPGAVATAGSTPSTFSNPVMAAPSSSFADPSVIRGRDGYWYSYTTSRLITIQRSANLVTWEPAGTVFTEQTRPSYFRPASGIWAPDVSWLDNRYVLTFTALDIATHPTPNRSIAVASAPTPTGPWTADDAPVVPPGTWQPFPDEPPRMQGIIDSELFTGPDGRRYLYYGGFGGGIWVTEVDRTVRRTIGEPVQVVAEDNFEAAYVVARDGWFYLFYSTGNCCTGGTSGYTVLVARSKSPRGPFVDRHGIRADGSYPGGTPVLTPNGNVWVGTGHSTQATDPSGQDWLLYHGVDRRQPWVDMTTQRPLLRPMMIDRLDWIDGWPVVREGRFASEGQVPVPATPTVADSFEYGSSPDPQAWPDSNGWTVRREPAGGYLHAEPRSNELRLRSTRRAGGDVRARAAVRTTGVGAVGLLLGEREVGEGVRVTLDARTGALVVTDPTPSAVEIARTPLPTGFDPASWHELEVSVRGSHLVARVSEAGLYDPLARISAQLPQPLRVGTLWLLASGAPADIDDVTTADLFTPQVNAAPDPSAGAEVTGFNEEFDGPLGGEWSWVREAGAAVRDGRLEFPVQSGELTRQSNSASVLLRDPPAGSWIVETRVTLDFENELVKRFPQAGLVVYGGDDEFIRLAVRGHGRLRTTEYGKETTYATGPAWGSVLNVAAAGPSTWLRLARTTHPDSGEQLYRAAVSRDGRTWVWGATYTMPAGSQPRLGLLSHGGDDAQLATFDYVRFHRTQDAG